MLQEMSHRVSEMLTNAALCVEPGSADGSFKSKICDCRTCDVHHTLMHEPPITTGGYILEIERGANRLRQNIRSICQCIFVLDSQACPYIVPPVPTMSYIIVISLCIFQYVVLVQLTEYIVLLERIESRSHYFTYSTGFNVNTVCQVSLYRCIFWPTEAGVTSMLSLCLKQNKKISPDLPFYFYFFKSKQRFICVKPLWYLISFISDAGKVSTHILPGSGIPSFHFLLRASLKPLVHGAGFSKWNGLNRPYLKLIEK